MTYGTYGIERKMKKKQRCQEPKKNGKVGHATYIMHDVRDCVCFQSVEPLLISVKGVIYIIPRQIFRLK